MLFRRMTAIQMKGEKRKTNMNEQHAIENPMSSRKQGRPLDIIVVASLTILFGLAEVVTGFTHNFFGITTSQATIFTFSSAAIGVFYALSGLLMLTMQRWAATLAIVLLGADIVGRITLVIAGLYPTDSLKNTLSIIAGTIIVAIIALYIGLRWKAFR
jgi:hypothetical protein